jgi:hypothetical protein
MKTKNRAALLVLSILVVSLLTGCGKAKNYGAAISNRVITRVEDILRNPDIYKGKTVTIKGKIVNECSTGCWFDIKDGEAVIYANIEPAGFAIPQKAGHSILVEGKVVVESGKPKISGTGVEVR